MPKPSVEIYVAGFRESITRSRDLPTAARTLGRKIGGYKKCFLSPGRLVGENLWSANLLRHDRHGTHIEAPVLYRKLS